MENSTVAEAVRVVGLAVAIPPDLLADGTHLVFRLREISQARRVPRARAVDRRAGPDQFAQLAGEGRGMERMIRQNQHAVAHAGGQDQVAAIHGQIHEQVGAAGIIGVAGVAEILADHRPVGCRVSGKTQHVGNRLSGLQQELRARDVVEPGLARFPPGIGAFEV